MSAFLPPPPPAIVLPSESHEWDKLLDAIAAVETGNDDFVVGKAGEHGRLQIKQVLWEQFTKLPYGMAVSREGSYFVARQIMARFAAENRARGIADKYLPDILATWFVCGRMTVPTPQKIADIKRILALYKEAGK